MSAAFGDWLTAQMSRCGFKSNVDLEAVTGIGNTTISRWRTGAMAPSVEQLRKLEGPLKTPLLEMLVRAGVLSAEEAKIPRAALSKVSEVTVADVAEAIRQDSELMERAREHLLSQYQMLRELSEHASSKKPRQVQTSPASQKPLRAVARKRAPRQDRS